MDLFDTVYGCLGCFSSAYTPGQHFTGGVLAATNRGSLYFVGYVTIWSTSNTTCQDGYVKKDGVYL